MMLIRRHDSTLSRTAGAAAAALLLATLAGCHSPKSTFTPRSGPEAGGSTNFVTVAETNRINPAWLKPSPEPFRLGPGDKLEIELLGLAGTRTTTFLCPDGKLYYDLLPGLEVWGLSLAETKALLERELAAYYQRPQISLNLRGVESKRVWVLGRLNKCGVYPLNGPMTILEAISQAGGLYTAPVSGTTAELADLNHSFFIRKGEVLPVNLKRLLRDGDMNQNIYLEPDDFLYLPSSLSTEIYVLGAVNRPAPLGFSDDISLASAISKALGVQPGAYLSHVAIVRGSLSAPQIAIVDFKAIMTGRKPDVRLEPRDIIYVPTSPYQTLDRYAKMITDSFVRVIAANEAGHAAAQSYEGITLTNPIH